MGAIWLYGAINIYKPSKYGWFISALQTWKKIRLWASQVADLPRVAQVLSWVCLLSPLHGIWATTRQRTPESRGASSTLSAFRRGTLTWIYSTALRKPWFNRGIWTCLGKKGGVLYYRGMATCKSYPSSNDHAGFSSCVSSWLVKMLTWSRKRSNDDLFKLMISIIHCCYTLILCGLHKTFLYSLVTSTCWSWYFIGRTWILLIYGRNGRTCHFGRALQSLGPRRIGTTFRQK